MSTDTPRRRIKATVTLEGDAEVILNDVQRLRTGKRTVHIAVSLPTPGFPRIMDDYVLPVIQGGNTQGAFERLVQLSHQSRIDPATDQRLDDLIKGFGQFTE